TPLVAPAAYQPDPAAAAAARRFVRQTLQSWDISERSPDADRVVDDAVLLTSELVTNAVVHAGTALDVTCRIASGELEIAVRDRHPARTLPDIPEAASPSAARGRGLLLPSARASSWGVTCARTAKAVWFRMSLPSREDADDQAAPPDGTDLISAALEQTDLPHGTAPTPAERHHPDLPDIPAADPSLPTASPSLTGAPSSTGSSSSTGSPS